MVLLCLFGAVKTTYVVKVMYYIYDFYLFAKGLYKYLKKYPTSTI